MKICLTCNHEYDTSVLCYCKCQGDSKLSIESTNRPNNCSICNKITEVKYYEDSWLCRQCFNIIEDLKK
jgi:hypothetical protein